jgi:short-subunit dehydrogenase
VTRSRAGATGAWAGSSRFGPWALVTGASSGLGERFALALASRQLNLVLVARREDRLAALADSLRRDHPAIDIRIVAQDLARPDAVERVIEATSDLSVGLLVCNAGAALTGDFLSHSRAEVLANFDLNSRTNVALCHHFGGEMTALGRGGIIVVSSIVGFTGVAGWATYAAAKAGSVALALALAQELAPRNVAVQALCPGHVSTEFHRHARIRALWPMTPTRVVDVSLAALGRRRLVVPGLFNKFCVFGLRLLPKALGARVYGWVLSGLRRRESE